MLLSPGTKASLVSERLRVQPPPDKETDEEPAVQDIPLVEVDHVLLGEHAALTTPALAELLRREIPVLVIASGLRLLGVCTPPALLSVARLAQFRKVEDPAFVRNIAAELVMAKVRNQRRVLQRLAANRADAAAGETLELLGQLADRASHVGVGAIDELRGIEGAAAQRYFAVLARFFPPHAPMNGRSRQPPQDPPNAVLSYCYTILCGEMSCHVHAVGLDPAVGCYHEPADRRAALALDLIEPFRAPIADALALDMFSHGQLDPLEHFEARDGGVFMNLKGRKRFHLAYERRLERAFRRRGTEEHTTLRNEMRAAALSMKMAIMEGRPFEAFRMG